MYGRKPFYLVGLLVSIAYVCVNWRGVAGLQGMSGFSPEWLQFAVLRACFLLIPVVSFGAATLGREQRAGTTAGFGALAWIILVGCSFLLRSVAGTPAASSVPTPLFALVLVVPSALNELGPFTVTMFLAMVIGALIPPASDDQGESACPQCGKKFPHDAHHLRCPGCGHNLLAGSAPAAFEAGMCPQCKRRIPPDEHGQFCGECGAALAMSGGPPRL